MSPAEVENETVATDGEWVGDTECKKYSTQLQCNNLAKDRRSAIPVQSSVPQLTIIYNHIYYSF